MYQTPKGIQWMSTHPHNVNRYSLTYSNWLIYHALSWFMIASHVLVSLLVLHLDKCYLLYTNQLCFKVISHQFASAVVFRHEDQTWWREQRSTHFKTKQKLDMVKNTKVLDRWLTKCSKNIFVYFNCSKIQNSIYSVWFG
jgi:hypothetical protein